MLSGRPQDQYTVVMYCICISLLNKTLSYRKEIARQLRTQYVEDVYTVFQKSKLLYV